VRGHGLGLYVDGRPALLEDVELKLEPDMTLIVHPNTIIRRSGISSTAIPCVSHRRLRSPDPDCSALVFGAPS